ncbi:MAG: helix-turn-helix domain-containing protein [Nanoarchaeota archaeon]
MSKLSQKTIEKVQEQVLSVLYENNPNALFANTIAKEIARDNEFVYALLKDLKKKGLVTSINKSKKGYSYIKRERWVLTPAVYDTYRNL